MNTPEIQHETETCGEEAAITTASTKNALPTEAKEELAEAVGESIQREAQPEQSAQDVRNQEALSHCESVIEQYYGPNSFYQKGEALHEIREHGLYKADFDSFEKYCEERWDMKRSTAYQYIKAYQLMENLRGKFDKLPANEAQARPLGKLDQEEQEGAWKDVLKRSNEGRITSDFVKQVVNYQTSPFSKKDRKPSQASDDSPSRIAERIFGIHADLFGRLEKASSKKRTAFMKNVFDALRRSTIGIPSTKDCTKTVTIPLAEGITMTISFDESAGSNDAEPTDEPEVEKGER